MKICFFIGAMRGLTWRCGTSCGAAAFDSLGLADRALASVGVTPGCQAQTIIPRRDLAAKPPNRGGVLFF